MKLTLKIKLLPTNEQANSLINTIKEANTCCNAISEIAWEKRVFQQFRLQKECYYQIKGSFSLSSQIIIQCISKVVNSYKLDRKTKREFRQIGAITYDSRSTRPTLAHFKEEVKNLTSSEKRVHYIELQGRDVRNKWRRE